MLLQGGGHVLIWSRPCEGIYYSFDGGVTMLHHLPSQAGVPTDCVRLLAVDPAAKQLWLTPEVADSSPPQIYHTGRWSAFQPNFAWTPAAGDLPRGTVSGLVGVGSGLPGFMVVVMTDAAGSQQLESFRTTNDGVSWERLGPVGNPALARDVRILVSAGGWEFFLGAVRAFYTSDLLNMGWAEKSLLGEHVDVRAIYADQDTQKVWFANDGAGSNLSDPQFNIVRWNWYPRNRLATPFGITPDGLKAWQLFAVMPLGATPPQTIGTRSRVFVGSLDNNWGCFPNADVSNDFTGLPYLNGVGDVLAIKGSAVGADPIYVRTASGTAMSRMFNARTVASCENVTLETIEPEGGVAAPFPWGPNSVAVHPTDPNKVYILRDDPSGQTPFLFSDDAGFSFWPTNPLDDRPQPVSIFVDPKGRVYVGTKDKGAFISNDDGQTWQPWGLNATPPAVILAVVVSGNVGWLATSDGLYRNLQSRNPNSRWELVTAGGGYVVSDVEVDPHCSTRIYATLGFVYERQQHRGGVRVSVDGGNTWSSLTSGLALHQSPIADVEVDPVHENLVYVASHGRGLWMYDWGKGPPACQVQFAKKPPPDAAVQHACKHSSFPPFCVFP